MARETSENIAGEDIYFVTHAGNMELNAAGTSLSPAELELLVLLDGKASVAAVESRMARAAPAAVRQTLAGLLDKGLIAAQEIDLSHFFAMSTPAQTPTPPPDERLVLRGVNSLQQHGYAVRIARRALSQHKLAAGEKLAVLVVEDDLPLARLMRVALEQGSFTVRMAANREEIVSAMRRPPVPDLVLLDVMLPDADGFDVLAKMRQHAALRSVPVIMATGKASREDVFKGLMLGANGYITKPFQVDVLQKAANEVLGINTEGAGGDPWYDERT